MTDRNALEQTQYLLCGLWEMCLSSRCDCTNECKGVRETKDGYWPVWGCTRGKLTLATKVVQPHLPDEWPDEWDDEFDAALRKVFSEGRPSTDAPVGPDSRG
jgi:hypothetical protein